MEDIQIKKLMRDEIDSYMKRKQFDLSKIPSHQHDGLDSPKVLQKNIVPGQVLTAFIVLTGSGTATLANLPNITTVSFQGFAANNATGPATKKAIINGLAQAGLCFSLSGIDIATVQSSIPSPFVQTCNSLYIDTTDLTQTQVGTSGSDFCYATDPITTVADVIITQFTSSTITFDYIMATGWKLQGSLILT